MSHRTFGGCRRLLSLVMAVAGTFLAAGITDAAEADRHVVIISIDGLAGFLLDDPKAPLPAIRQLAREGAFVEGGMRVSNPSVTWPNHTSIVTGVRPEKHSTIANGVLVRGGVGVPVVIDPRQDKSALVRVLTLYDRAHAAGLATGEINWPCTRGATTLDDSFPDVPETLSHSTPRLVEELVAAGILKDETDASFRTQSAAGRDHVWTEAACHLIRNRMPNLLLLHLLNVDGTHHAFGAQTSAGYTANAYADACVARVLAALEEAGVRERTTVFVVSDHGFIRTPQAIRPNIVLRKAGLLKADGARISEAQVNVVPEGGIGLVYCNVPGQVEADSKRVKELFEGLEGVEEILEPAQYAEHGLPHPREYRPAPDLVLVAKEGYGVSGSVEGDDFVTTHTEARTSLGSHGFLARNPKMNGICVVAGRGIRPGVVVQKAENIDVAPTAARLLGLADFEADGRVLTEILEAETKE